MKITTNETGTRRIASLTGADIAYLLKANDEARTEMGVDDATKLDVVFRVPSGGDYSGMQIDIAASDPVVVSWNTTTQAVRDDSPFTASEIDDILTVCPVGTGFEALTSRGWSDARCTESTRRISAWRLTHKVSIFCASDIVRALATPVPASAPKPAASITFTIDEVVDIFDAGRERGESTLLDHGWKPARIEAYRALMVRVRAR